MIQVQVAIIYLNSSIAKLGVPEWDDGTAMYYWLHSNVFGAGWLRPILWPVVGSALGVLVITWAPLMLEFLIGCAIFMRSRARWMLLAGGIIFHLSIAVVMGLVSFDFAMTAALILVLVPVGWDFQLGAWHPRLARSRRYGTAGQDAPSAASPSLEGLISSPNLSNS
jgi:antimicrobial peptide system SdpB family protein